LSSDNHDESDLTEWVLRIKRTAGGILSKLKARICVRGDLETEGVHFETYASTAKWTTIRFMLVMARLRLMHVSNRLHISIRSSGEKPPNWKKCPRKNKINGAYSSKCPRILQEGHAKIEENLYGRSSAPDNGFRYRRRDWRSRIRQQLDVDPSHLYRTRYYDPICRWLTSVRQNQKDLDEALVKLRSDSSSNVGGFQVSKLTDPFQRSHDDPNGTDW
jgi:hypothetical protein